jgi:transposase
MSTMTHARAGQQCCSPVTGGVDTHKDTHTAAVLDATGRLLGHRQFPATPAGYAQLLAWLGGHGELDKVGVEGNGAYGAGLARFLPVKTGDHPLPQAGQAPKQRRLATIVDLGVDDRRGAASRPAGRGRAGAGRGRATRQTRAVVRGGLLDPHTERTTPAGLCWPGTEAAAHHLELPPLCRSRL